MSDQESLPVDATEVCSRAMVLVGLERLQSFSEIERDEVVVAGQIYELIVADCMSAYPWDFCSGQQRLHNDPVPPLDRFETAWHLPALPTGQPYFLDTVRCNDCVIFYEVMADRIFCNVDAAESVIAHYQYRVAEPFWPPRFTLMVVERLAEKFATSVTRNKQQIESAARSYETQFARAKTRDAMQHTTKNLRPVRFTRFRRTGAGLPGNVAR